MDNNFFRQNSNEITQIYNMEANKENGQFLLQTKQLIVYYNFRRKFKEALEKGHYNLNNTSNNNQNSRHYIQNVFCLIDQEWIEKWKKHVGYKEIVNYCQNNKIFRDLDDNDYTFIKPFIEKNSKENLLPLLDNQNIYNEKDDQTNPYSDFYIVDRDCYKLFTFGNDARIFNDKTAKTRFFPVKFLKNKLILMFSIKIYLLIFKDEHNKYFEILLEFQDDNEGRKKTLDHLERLDINKYIREKQFELDSNLEKILNFFGCKFKVINKTLKFHKKNKK